MQYKASTKEILLMALPIMFSSIMHNIIAITDGRFMSHIGSVELAAVGLASVFYFNIIFILFGFMRAIQILVARRCGQNRPIDAGKILDQALYSAIFLAFFITVLLFLSMDTILQWTIHSSYVYNASRDFLTYRAIAILFEAITLSLVAFLNGINKNRIIIISSLLAVLINIFMNYVFVFGNWGIPAMGISGCGLASAIAEVCTFIIITTTLLLIKEKKQFQYFTFPKIHWRAQQEIFALALPIIGQGLIAIISWYGFFAFIENIGTTELAGSNILKNIYMFICLPIFAFSNTMSSFSSNYIGQEKGNLIFMLYKKIVGITLLFLLPGLLALFLFPDFLIQCVSKDIVANSIAKDLLWVIFASVIIFSLSSIAFNIVAGIGDSKMSLYLEAINITWYFGYIIVITKLFHIHNLTWVWFAEILYWIVLGLGTLWYFSTARSKVFLTRNILGE